MSIAALAHVFKMDIRPASLKLTLIAYADCSNDHMLCWPSIEHLRETTSLNRKTLLQNVEQLVSLGLLVDTGDRRGRTNQVKVYRLCVLNDAVIGTVGKADKRTVPKPEQYRKVAKGVPVSGPKSPVFTAEQAQKRDTEPLSNLKQPLENPADEDGRNYLREISSKEKSLTPMTPEPGAGDHVTQAIEIWNDTARRFGLVPVERVSQQRRDMVADRLAECGGLEGWSTALDRIGHSSWLRGENKTGWRANFNFLLEAKNLDKLAEGGYDDRSAAEPTLTQPQPSKIDPELILRLQQQARVSAEDIRRWFNHCEVSEQRLVAQTKFMADQIENRFGDRLRHTFGAGFQIAVAS